MHNEQLNEWYKAVAIQIHYIPLMKLINCRADDDSVFLVSAFLLNSTLFLAKQKNKHNCSGASSRTLFHSFSASVCDSASIVSFA